MTKETTCHGQANKERPKEALTKSEQVFSWAKALVYITVIIAFSVLLGLHLFFDQFKSAMTESIKLETVTSKFGSFIVGLQGMNHLQVAKLKTQEEYFLTSEKKLLKYLPAGTVEVAARVPCEINYHVNLKNSKWQFVLADSGRRLHVIAPEISFNQPSIDMSRYELEVIKYSYIRDNEEVKQLLQDQIPEKLNEVAMKNIDSIRDTARLSIKDFVENWLLASLDGQPLPVVDRVYFADEQLLFQKIIVNDRVESVMPEAGL